MTASPVGSSGADNPIEHGDVLDASGQIKDAIAAYRAAVTETPAAELCLKLARCYERIGEHGEARRWALAVVDAGDHFTAWQTAAALIGRIGREHGPAPLRSARLALVGSYTTTQFVPLLRLAALRLGVDLEIYESRYGQYRQEILHPRSDMYAFEPDFVLLAVHEGDLALPDFSDASEAEVESELSRWTALWRAVAQNSRARVIQPTFACAPEVPFGHLGARLPGSRYMMTQALNARLGAQAADDVLIVDCERLASFVGREQWFDPRYWYLAKHAVALGALPLLARHTAAVLAGSLGLSKKCLVLDLDNTLWGGVIGEDGLAGLHLGNGVKGEAFVAFQEYLLKLKRRGVILAVCSKNNEADAREPFEQHPEMRLRLDDIAVFVANWQPKPDQIGTIAQTLNIGLDSIVFVDDNPVERESVRQLLPEVEVLPLPTDPSQYVRTLSRYLLFEADTFTMEDAKRTEQYRARAAVATARAEASSLEELHRSLQMRAVLSPFTEVDLPRIAQLIGKTNQFNLTTRRHSLAQLRAFMADPHYIHMSLRLRDRFTDHGLVSLLIAVQDGETLDIDTWLMSCRVIGRTVEAEMLKHLCREAARRGCTSIRGTYIRTSKNDMVAHIFAQFDFEQLDGEDYRSIWIYDLAARKPIENEFIESTCLWEKHDDVARAAPARIS